LIQKKQGLLARSGAGSQPVHSSEPKAYYPASTVCMSVETVASVHVGEQKRLVSVLDLDNAVRFSRDIEDKARKHSVNNLLRRGPN